MLKVFCVCVFLRTVLLALPQKEGETDCRNFGVKQSDGRCRCFLNYAGKLCDRILKCKTKVTCDAGRGKFDNSVCRCKCNDGWGGPGCVTPLLQTFCMSKPCNPIFCADQCHISRKDCSYIGKQPPRELCRTLGNNGYDTDLCQKKPFNCSQCNNLTFVYHDCPVACGFCAAQLPRTATILPTASRRTTLPITTTRITLPTTTTRITSSQTRPPSLITNRPTTNETSRSTSLSSTTQLNTAGRVIHSSSTMDPESNRLPGWGIALLPVMFFIGAVLGVAGTLVFNKIRNNTTNFGKPSTTIGNSGDFTLNNVGDPAHDYLTVIGGNNDGIKTSNLMVDNPQHIQDNPYLEPIEPKYQNISENNIYEGNREDSYQTGYITMQSPYESLR